MTPTAPDAAPGSQSFQEGNPAIVVDRKGRKYLMFLKAGHKFQLRGGFIASDDVLGRRPGYRLESSSGELVTLYRPTIEEYILLMPRGAQIVTPKDIGLLIQWGDIFPGAHVVEAGIGSGALTLALLRAVGPKGHVVAYELREDFANCARNNIAAWPEPLEDRLEICLGDVHKALEVRRDVDRVILDLPDPWNAIAGASKALRPGGILVAYSPTIRQMDQLIQVILDQPELAPPDLVEVIMRPWVGDRVRLRPELRIVGHTGFLLRTRRRANRSSEQSDKETQ